MTIFSTKNLTDEEVIHLIKEGDARYFGALAERYRATILSKCKSMVKSEDVAKDLSQEILIKVFLQLKAYRKDARFSTWLYSIIYHTCIDHMRKDKKRQHLVLSEKLIDEIADLVEDQDMEEELTIPMMESLLDRLSQDEKIILLLKYKDKHSIQDIQQSLGLSQSAVKMRIKRARQHINDLLKG
ncbi:hypothetical protein BFP72_13055 [Reichenbachiella sp. 5M10]|uniref:RNA polymerase sigma factor n=1 Tax=Reichenbachiella sp. 5M10 TaxID=1889772 RepID=UPI000C158DD5|nr:RNA polymerase sigma factor [Reichenbachiella sp. 5M10]PIB36251.1 hypothetical protein BFP72_13055 [Reichenbachiella sp. 5M10]